MESNNTVQPEEALDKPISENTSIPASKKGKKLLLLFILIPLAILFLIGIAAYLFITKINVKQINRPQPFIATFDDCIRTKGHQTIDSYPRECKTVDKITFIEKIKEPIDMTRWATYSDLSGITFECPPNWCSKISKGIPFVPDRMFISHSGFVDMVVDLITPTNFQQSLLKDNYYETPITWYNAILEKNSNALKPPESPELIKRYTESDTKLTNHWYSSSHFDLSKMEAITIASKSATYLGSNYSTENGGTLIIPFNKNILIIQGYKPGDVLAKAILHSIIFTPR